MITLTKTNIYSVQNYFRANTDRQLFENDKHNVEVAYLEKFLRTSMNFRAFTHGRRKDFCQGGGSRGFSQNFFSRGDQKWWNLVFPLKYTESIRFLFLFHQNYLE